MSEVVGFKIDLSLNFAQRVGIFLIKDKWSTHQQILKTLRCLEHVEHGKFELDFDVFVNAECKGLKNGNSFYACWGNALNTYINLKLVGFPISVSVKSVDLKNVSSYSVFRIDLLLFEGRVGCCPCLACCLNFQWCRMCRFGRPCTKQRAFRSNGALLATQ